MSHAGMDYVWRYPRRVARALASDPLSLWDTFRERLTERREYARPTPRYVPDTDWEDRLHALLGMRRDGDAAGELKTLWRFVVAQMTVQGIAVGPASFAGFNDGDGALIRAIWILMHALKPERVVETGVGHGFTSRIILEAMERNRCGRLYSIDRPPLDPVMRARVGIAVPAHLRQRWSLIPGTSRRRLPPLLKNLGLIDFFIHDSRHTARNVTFELAQAWEHLRPGGAAVVDDIDSNWGFDSFRQSNAGFTHLICDAEPVRPDTRRFNQKGQFAIILKDSGGTG